MFPETDAPWVLRFRTPPESLVKKILTRVAGLLLRACRVARGTRIARVCADVVCTDENVFQSCVSRNHKNQIAQNTRPTTKKFTRRREIPRRLQHLLLRGMGDFAPSREAILLPKKNERRRFLPPPCRTSSPQTLRCVISAYCRFIFTRRFCGSRTPSSVETSGELSPFASMAIPASGMPSVTKALFTMSARRVDSA